ncbi:MAG: VanW family protein [Clostridia bacterium]|nr:VanW family protein [Clostridia bacterium]
MASKTTKKSEIEKKRKRTVKSAPGKARVRAKSAKRKHAVSSKSKKHIKHSRRREAYCWWALPVSCFMILFLSAAILFSINEYGEYRRFRVMRSAVENEGFYNGVVVDNYSLSGVTFQDAVAHWENNIEPAFKNRTLTLKSGEKTWTISAEELGYRSNYLDVLYTAWGLGRSGTLEERYRSINMIRENAEWHDVKRTMFDTQLLRKWTDGIASSLTTSEKNAQITGFDVNSRTFTFSSASAGSAVDKDALFESAKAMLASGGGQIEVQVETINPSVTQDSFSGKFGMITSAVTNASSSNKNRMTNLQLACDALNGYCVEPGATFSFNEVVGQRTAKRGYKKATVYQSGEIAEDIGGGVCQVSTTLWNAAMKANCEIVERHPHSRPVSYVDRGKDATVSWGSQDMKFKNTSNSPMYLVCYISENKRVYCDIYGELFPDGKYITIEGVTTQRINPDEPVYTYNPLLEPGATTILSEPRTGYRAKAYRIYWNADGTEITRDLLCESYYRPARGEVEYG